LCDSFLGEGGGRGLLNYAIFGVVAKPLPAFAHEQPHPSPRRELKSGSRINNKTPIDLTQPGFLFGYLSESELLHFFKINVSYVIGTFALWLLAGITLWLLATIGRCFVHILAGCCPCCIQFFLCRLNSCKVFS
jgi:hypothetical protein